MKLLTSMAWKPNNRLIYTEKTCIASFYRKFSTNIKIKIIKLIKVFHFNIRGNLSIYNIMQKQTYPRYRLAVLLKRGEVFELESNRSLNLKFNIKNNSVFEITNTLYSN